MAGVVELDERIVERDPDGAAIVTIDRATRDMIWRVLVANFEYREYSAGRIDRQDVHRVIGELTMVAGVFDSLGWQEDDERVSYSLRVDNGVGDWLGSMIRYYDENEDDQDWSPAFEPQRQAILAAIRTVLDLAQGVTV